MKIIIKCVNKTNAIFFIMAKTKKLANFGSLYGSYSVNGRRYLKLKTAPNYRDGGGFTFIYSQ